MKIEPGDRRLLISAGVLVLLVVLALAFLSPNEEESAIPSTYSAQSRGAKAAFLLLQESGYNVERWEQPPTALTADPTHAVLILASPFRVPTREERNALQLFLDHGGKILATGSNISVYLPDAEIELETLPAPSPKKYQPQLITPVTRGGGIEMSPTSYWKGPATRSLAHYADEGRPIVVSYKVGNGEVIWWGGSTPLTNAAIAKSGNLALLLNSLGAAEKDAPHENGMREDGPIHIFWDEYFHGQQGSLISYVTDPPLLSGLLQCGLVFLALLFTFSRRNGPIRPLPQPSRLSPLEFIHTLGRLYHRANAVHSALQIPYTRFRTMAARRLGISQDITAAELANSLRNRLNYKDDSLASLLLRVETALHNPELKEAEALELAQQLSRHTQNLKLIPTEKQETTFHADRVTGAHARTN